MAYLTEEDRNKLKAELQDMPFNAASFKLKRMDPKGRLAFYRNSQRVGEWWTRYELVGLGTRVTLVEKHFDQPSEKDNRTNAEFGLVDVIVEPTPDNRL